MKMDQEGWFRERSVVGTVSSFWNVNEFCRTKDNHETREMTRNQTGLLGDLCVFLLGVVCV
jgi:hypothetical protein